MYVPCQSFITIQFILYCFQVANAREFILTDNTSLSAAELFLKHLYIFLTYTNKKKYIMQQNNEWFTRMIYLNVVILT